MLTVDFINVGYGDAILIRDLEADFSMLVDCGDMTTGNPGPESARITASDFLEQAGIQRLDLLVLTHLHRDHSGGLTELLKKVHVQEFWTNYLPARTYWGKTVRIPSEFSAGARCLLESMNIYLSALCSMEQSGTKIHLKSVRNEMRGLSRALRAEIYLEDPTLHQRQADIWRDVLEDRADNAELDELDRFINNTSIRLRLFYGEKTIELPGDVYADCWEQHQISPCTIVKLPHHGHRDSVTPRLLDMLAPEYVVISVSNTRTDDCPAASVLDTVQKRNCHLYITDAVERPNFVECRHRAVHFSIDPAGQIASPRAAH